MSGSTLRFGSNVANSHLGISLSDGAGASRKSPWFARLAALSPACRVWGMASVALGNRAGRWPCRPCLARSTRIDDQLANEFRRIKVTHRAAMRTRVARCVLGPSVVRVFAAGTKPGLVKALARVPVDELPEVVKRGTFDDWYECQLERVASRIRILNRDNRRVLPGLKWGHAAKVLNLFLRDIVEHTRYFTDRETKAIGRALHVPVDGIVIKRLRALGVAVPCRQIKEIASRDTFRQFQEVMDAAATAAGVPRTWFDDNWADRQ